MSRNIFRHYLRFGAIGIVVGVAIALGLSFYPSKPAEPWQPLLERMMDNEGNLALAVDLTAICREGEEDQAVEALRALAPQLSQKPWVEAQCQLLRHFMSKVMGSDVDQRSVDIAIAERMDSLFFHFTNAYAFERIKNQGFTGLRNSVDESDLPLFKAIHENGWSINGHSGTCGLTRLFDPQGGALVFGSALLSHGLKNFNRTSPEWFSKLVRQDLFESRSREAVTSGFASSLSIWKPEGAKEEG